MPAWGAILLIPPAGFIPGWLVVRQLTRGRLSLPLAFAALTLGLFATGWLALLLAEFGVFSAGRLALMWGVVVVGLLLLERRRNGRERPVTADDGRAGLGPPLLPRLPAWAEVAFLLVWLAAAAWLFFRPHETVLGAADAGVYVSLGASIAREGSIIIHDETLAGLDEALYPALLRPLPDPVAPYYLLPGFYVDGEPPGEITPQFYPQHPVWYAVAFGLVAATQPAGAEPEAIRAMLLLNGLWAALGSLAVYLIVRQLAGWEIAALALVALSLTALQVWFARYSTTEVLTQYALWAGLYGLGMWLGRERHGALWALLAGVSLGVVFLMRVDMLVLLPVLGLLGLWLLAGGRRAGIERRTAAWFLVPLTLLIAHSFAHAWLQSRPYFLVHSGLGVALLLANWAIPAVAAVAGVAFVYLLWRAGPRFMAEFGRYRKYALVALMAVVLIFAVYGWFVRPVVGEPVARTELFSQETVPLTDHENWRRLGWYLSPVGVWLGVAGTLVLIRRLNRRTAVMLAVGALFAALYLWSLRANPHQIYAMRRFVPAVVPFFTVAAAVFVDRLARRPRWGGAVAGVLAVVWLGGLVWSARGFVSQVDHAGLTAQIHELNASFAPGAVLLFNDGVLIGSGDFFGTPLKYIYGRDVFVIRDPAQLSTSSAYLVQQMEMWHNNGLAVYWIGDPAWLAEQGLAYREETHVLSSSRLESTYERKPTAILTDEWILRVAQVDLSP